MDMTLFIEEEENPTEADMKRMKQDIEHMDEAAEAVTEGTRQFNKEKKHFEEMTKKPKQTDVLEAM
ncbi:hypothetical protein PMIN03_009016 [Paraphaeosphaeria minitans]